MRYRFVRLNNDLCRLSKYVYIYVETRDGSTFQLFHIILDSRTYKISSCATMVRSRRVGLRSDWRPRIGTECLRCRSHLTVLNVVERHYLNMASRVDIMALLICCLTHWYEYVQNTYRVHNYSGLPCIKLKCV